MTLQSTQWYIQSGVNRTLKDDRNDKLNLIKAEKSDQRSNKSIQYNCVKM